MNAEQLWDDACRQQSLVINRSEPYIGIPLIRQPADAMTLRTFTDVLMLSPVGDRGRRLSRSDRAVLVDVGKVLQRSLEMDHERDINRRLLKLSAIARSPRRPVDVSYAVANALRDTLDYEGACAVVRTDIDRHVLEVMAVLPGKGDESPSIPAVEVPWDVTGAPDGNSSEQAQTSSLFRQALLSSGAGITGLRRVSIDDMADNRTPAGGEKHIALIISALATLRRHEILTAGSTLTIPQFEGGQLLGFVSVALSRADAIFTGEQIKEAWPMAAYAVTALAKARTLESDLLVVQQVLAQAAQTNLDPLSAGTATSRAVLPLLINGLRSLVRADSIVVLPYDYKTDRIDASAAISAGPIRVPQAKQPADNGLLRRTLLLGELEDDGDPGSNASAFIRERRITQVYSVALLSKAKRPVGILFVNWVRDQNKRDPRTGGVMQHDRLRIKEVAQIVERYLAQDNDLRATAQLQRLTFSLYRDLVSTAGSTLSRQLASDQVHSTRVDLLRVMMEGAIKVLGGTAGVFAAPSTSFDGLEPIIAIGHDKADAFSAIPYGEGVTGACAVRRQCLIIQDSSDTATFPQNVEPLRRVEAAKSEIAFPVIDDANGVLLGVIDLENQRTRAAFNEAEDRPALQRLAQATQLIYHVSWQMEQLQSVSRLAGRLRAAQRLSEADLLQAVLEEAMLVTGAYSGTARLVDRSGRHLDPAAESGVKGSFSGRSVPVTRGATGLCFRRGVPILHRDLEPARESPDYLKSRAETRSEAALPVTYGADKIGVLNFEFRQQDGWVPYTDYLTIVAGQASAALYDYRRYRRRLRNASNNYVDVLTSYYFTVSHSISDQFRTIEENLSALQAAPLEGKQRAALQGARRAAEDGTKRALAALSAASGAIEDEREQDVVDIARTTVDEVAAAADREGRVSFQGPPEPAIIRCREVVLRWIIREIIDNSLKHGGDRVHVSVSVMVDIPSRSAVINIRDDGVGLSEDAMEGLFTLEDKWEATAGNKSKGTGVGLLGVKAYLETMYGRIEATSHDGLSISLVFPIASGSEQESA